MSEHINVIANIIIFTMYVWSLYERHKLKKEILWLEKRIWERDYR